MYHMVAHKGHFLFHFLYPVKSVLEINEEDMIQTLVMLEDLRLKIYTVVLPPVLNQACSLAVVFSVWG